MLILMEVLYRQLQWIFLDFQLFLYLVLHLKMKIQQSRESWQEFLLLVTLLLKEVEEDLLTLSLLTLN